MVIIHVLGASLCVYRYKNTATYVHVCNNVFAVVEVVPHLNSVLSRMITQLGAIKHENMQWVFSYG